MTEASPALQTVDAAATPNDAVGSVPARSAVWTALLIAILLLYPAGSPRPEVVALLLIFGAALAVSLRFGIGPVVIIALALAGLWLRQLDYHVGGSDVLPATIAAIGRATSGQNPYVVTEGSAPYAYGPVALLWYLPARRDPILFEFGVSLFILFVLAIRGRPVGLAVYALVPTLIIAASDGSNDTSAGLFLLAAILVLRRQPRWGAFALAIAAGFKLYAAAWWPPAVMWAGFAAVEGFVLGSVLVWGPAVLFWGVGPIVTSLVAATGVHGGSYFTLAQAIEGTFHTQVSRTDFERMKLVYGAIAALMTAPFVRTATGVIVAGTIIYAVTLFTGYWATTVYLATLAPVLCWHLDDWLGFKAQRISWPTDPVGRLSQFLDTRWPPRVSGRRSAAWSR